jgi:DNA-binding transcriptional LysR family regulator
MTSMLYLCFITAMETLNFTTAAQKVHITQPAFSRNIAALERELGFPLFWRSKQNGLRVSPAGLAMYNGLKSMAQEYEELVESARSISRGEQGKLIISILNGCCMDSKVFQVIHDFQRQYPKIAVELISCSFAQLIASVENGKSDVCFCLEFITHERDKLLHETVYSVESYLAVPARLGCEKYKEYGLFDFKDEVFLLSEDSPKINEVFVEACRMAGFEPKTKMAPDYETKMLWVEIGEGLAANSYEHYMKSSKYVDFVKIKELHPVDCALVWNKDNYNPSIALFYSMCDEIMT